MKRGLVLMFAALWLAAAPAVAAPILFTADLTGAAESPANGSPGTGTALVTIDPVTHLMRVEIAFQDLLGTTTASHIHVINGPGDANLLDTLGPVATSTPTFPGFPLGVTAGSYDQTLDMLLASSYRAGFITDAGGTTALAEAALFDAITSGRAYLNVHSTVLPGGEIRGFLRPVPEPTLLVLLATGGVAFLGNRRRRRPSMR